MTFVVAALFGLAFGSFANAAIDRIATGRSLFGRSCCDGCVRTLAAAELIPVLSYLLLRGRCASCRAPIGARTLLVEVTCGVAFAMAFGSAQAVLATVLCTAIVGILIGGGLTLRRARGAA